MPMPDQIDCTHPFELGRMEVRRMPDTRAADGSGSAPAVTLAGYAAKFNVLSEMMWDFQETIAPGAFDDVMGDDVRALFNHDPNHILGRTLSGTLRISLDTVGLTYEVDLPGTEMASTVAAAVERGDVTQSSFAFVVNEATWTERQDGTWLRTITKLKRLYDVSPVTYPGYPDATVGMRSGFVKAQVEARDAALAARETETRGSKIAMAAEERRRKLAIIGR
jgi:uncharacterized protein